METLSLQDVNLSPNLPGEDALVDEWREAFNARQRQADPQTPGNDDELESGERQGSQAPAEADASQTGSVYQPSNNGNDSGEDELQDDDEDENAGSAKGQQVADGAGSEGGAYAFSNEDEKDVEQILDTFQGEEEAEAAAPPEPVMRVEVGRKRQLDADEDDQEVGGVPEGDVPVSARTRGSFREKPQMTEKSTTRSRGKGKGKAAAVKAPVAKAPVVKVEPRARKQPAAKKAKKGKSSLLLYLITTPH